jgi:hypothetical protein
MLSISAAVSFSMIDFCAVRSAPCARLLQAILQERLELIQKLTADCDAVERL